MIDERERRRLIGNAATDLLRLVRTLDADPTIQLEALRGAADMLDRELNPDPAFVALTAKAKRLGEYLRADDPKREVLVVATRPKGAAPYLEILCYGVDPTTMPTEWEGGPVRIGDRRDQRDHPYTVALFGPRRDGSA